MNEIRLKIKEWGEAIKLAKFHGIAEKIQNVNIVDPPDEINKAMYKLILYLCQTAQECDKTNISNGIDIFNITHAICSKLTSIPDTSKYFAGIYHIVCYLIDMKLFKEAMKIGDYLYIGSLFYATCMNCIDMHAKFSNMWYKTIEKQLSTLKKIDEKIFEWLMLLINYELKFQVLSLKDGSKYLLNKIMAYNDKIKLLDQHQFYHKFRSRMMNFIEYTNIWLGDENKFQTYKSALRFLNDVVIDEIITDIIAVSDRIKQFFTIFKNCMITDEECYKCFMLYEQLCHTLIRSSNEFESEHYSSLQIYMNDMDEFIKKYGKDNTIKFNLYSIIKIFDALILFWDKYDEHNKKINISEEFIKNITALIRYQGHMFSNFYLPVCHCHEEGCQMTVDIYNDVIMKLKVLKLITQYITNDNLSQNLVNIVIEIADECIQSIYNLHTAGCKHWCKLWLIIGPLVHNIAVHYEKINYEDTVRLYTLLATTTIKLNAFGLGTNYITSDNPLCVLLYRLSSTHYSHGKYENAMIACALSAYVGYKEEKCKAFKFWASIKYKYPPSHGTTIIKCLKSNKNAAKGIGIKMDWENSKLVTICTREIQGLQEADINLTSSIVSVLDLLSTLNVLPTLYAQCVLRLGHHMLNFHCDNSILQYINKALSNLKHIVKCTPADKLLEGQLKFYELIEDLKQINKITEEEMQNTKIKLHAENNSNQHGNPASNLVPAYSLVNVTTASNISEKLKKILQIWMEHYKKVDINTNKFVEPNIFLRTVIVAAEYTKFYQYSNLEKDAWKIAYNIATKLHNDMAIVYITGRCILSRHINNEWIQCAEKCVEKLTKSTDQTTIENIAMFKLCLAEFYFNMGLISRGNELFEEAVALPNIKFGINLATYLLSVDILLSHKFNFDYIENIVKGLYTMLTIDDIGSVTRHRREEFLYELDILFQFTNHVTLRMNNLISYREIYAHLVRRLSIAQKLCAPFHVAECLKNLCFIDISRHEFEDCEVKLQGLEHILMIETVKLSMQSNFPVIQTVPQLNITPNEIIEPIRDTFQNDTSPVLRTKVFSQPNFMNHDKKCKCFNCCNTAYQYLVFSSTHIRAQLYGFQNNIPRALEHFYGAFNIIRKILNFSSENIGNHYYHNIVEYVLFILDFARFLKHSVPKYFNDALNVALHAVDVCERYKIINSPVYITARELIYEFRFQNVFEDIDYSKFMMPNTFNIDDKYFNGSHETETISTTPVRTIAPKFVQSVRRRKTPPLLTLSKVSIDTIEDDDTLTMSSLRPTIDNISKKKKPVKIRPIRREISDEEYFTNENSDGIDSKSISHIDNVNIKQASQKRNKTRTESKLRKKIFESSDESSGEYEDIDKIGDILEKIQVCESSNVDKLMKQSVNKNDKNTKIRKTSSRLKMSKECIQIPNNINYDILNRSNHSESNVKKSISSNERKMENYNVLLPISSSSKFMNASSSSEDNNEFHTSTKNNSNCNDDIVECSFEEPRRSRRLAVKTKQT